VEKERKKKRGKDLNCCKVKEQDWKRYRKKEKMKERSRSK
jgi:hypothetical protein